jgi:two-component system, NtrC family, response regulator HydG
LYFLYRFGVTLRQRQEGYCSDLPRGNSDMSTKPLSILVVDDDVDNAMSLGELFELEGHNVTMVHSGQDAVGAYLHSHFDVAFMDVMMPGKSGVESFMEIRRFKPSAKVFMMTGYSVEQLVQQAIEHGALGVFSKPMAPDAILDVLHTVGTNGVVVAEPQIGRSAEEIQKTLREAGRRSRIVREPRSIMHEKPNAEDGVLICELRGALIEGVGIYSSIKKNGFDEAAIMLTKASSKLDDATPLLRDFTVTGVLNKPFDPVELLNSLPLLAS